MTTASRLLTLIATALLVTGCSGGGGGGGNSSGTAPSGSSGNQSPTPVTPPPSTPTTPTTPTPPTTPPVSHTLNLSWSIPTTRENGTALSISELAGYQIYYYQDGTSAGAGEVVDISGGTTTSTQISINGSGTYYLAIAARDQAGLLSNLSNYVSVSLN